MLRHILILAFFLAAFPPLTALAATNDTKLFLGTWCGQWEGGPQNRLTVERVSDDGIASGIYAMGTSSNVRPFDFFGKINDGVLNIEFSGGSLKISYRLTKNDTLIGRWKKGLKALIITSKRC